MPATNAGQKAVQQHDAQAELPRAAGGTSQQWGVGEGEGALLGLLFLQYLCAIL